MFIEASKVAEDEDPWGSEDDPQRPVERVQRVEWVAGAVQAASDTLVREEPLEIRVNGVSVAVLMRTPGHDVDLVRGFLRTEGVVEDLASVRSIRHCDVVDDPESEGNVVRVGFDGHLDIERFRRNMFASSSCGICGKASITRALQVAKPFGRPASIDVERLLAVMPRMRDEQVVFGRTGGLHAAAAFDRDGRIIVLREDVGRHNAVDKVVGALSQTDQSPAGLAVSGRVSFEIVQKALAARLPVVVAVSAPSSLAVRLARQVNMTVVGFARGQRAVVFSGEIVE